MASDKLTSLRQLSEDRFVFGKSETLLEQGLTQGAAWRDFQDFFNSLPIDEHMNDGGTYRQRRFGRFAYSVADAELIHQAHKPYIQPKYFNPLNGGIPRNFAPLTPAMVVNEITQCLLKNLARTYSAIEGQASWRINTYFNRILASANQIGKPVPEGMHRDGMKFSCLFMVNAVNFSGGETTLFDLISHKPIFQGRLSEGGQMLIFRDDTVLHDTTSIRPIDTNKKSYRDVLVIEFY